MVDRAAAGGGTSYSLQGIVPYQSAAPQGSGGPADWFGPGNPMPPVAPPEVRGRTLDYPSAYNLSQKPRAYEPVSFDTLRNLAQAYDILRLVIETRKDQMAAIEWRIIPKDPTAKVTPGSALEKEIAEVNAFLESPDKEHDWDTWLRLVLEDLFVIDAPTIYPHYTIGGDLYRLKVIDGATIKRVIDDWGDTPLSPAPAYQQVLKGLGAVNYTRDQLLYRPRNKRANKIYGFSQVEQVIAITNIGLRREAWQMQYFTAGNLPDALIGTPNEWTPDQIRNFQDWFDARLMGNTGSRRGATFVPGDVAKGYVATKETELFGKAEEWLARVVCYAFNVTPQAFTMMMNRATAETQADTATSEGIVPLKRWVMSLMNHIIRVHMKKPHLSWAWADEKEIDPKVQSEIFTAYQDGAILSVNAIRAKIGEDPDPSPEANMLMVKTSSGFVPLALADQVEAAKTKLKELGPPPGTEGGPGSPPGGESSGGDGSAPGESGDDSSGEGGGGSGKAALPATASKRAPIAPLTIDRPLLRSVDRRLAKITAAALKAAGASVAAQVEEYLEGQGVKKADDPFKPAVDIDPLVASLDLSSLDVLIDTYAEGLFDVASDSTLQALAQVGAPVESDLVNQVNREAEAFARERAAELVGMRYTEDGALIENPNAKFAITPTTRKGIRKLIANGLDENIGTRAIAQSLIDAYEFSGERASLIANTEVANANEQSKLKGYRIAGDLGIDLKKSWLTVGDDRVDPHCVANANAGAIAIDEDFPSGHDAPLAHPRCRCVLVPEIEE